MLTDSSDPAGLHDVNCRLREATKLAGGFITHVYRDPRQGREEAQEGYSEKELVRQSQSLFDGENAKHRRAIQAGQ